MSYPPGQIIFFGTSDFAAVILKRLYQSQTVKITLAVTQPDQPVGRHQTLTPPPVKILADQLGLPVIQPTKLDEQTELLLKKYPADLFLVAAYGLIIPHSILDIPRLGCLNIHPSLLPLYRGPSPIQTCLLNGDQITGVSLMLLDAKMDHGPLIAQIKSPLAPNDNYETLAAKLADQSAALLLATLPKIFTGQIKPQEQNHAAATFTKIINKQDGRIDWNDNAEKIYNQWRAYFLWPNVFSLIKINNKNLLIKFNELKISGEQPPLPPVPGQLFVYNKKLLAACGSNTYLEIMSLQPEGKNIMTAQSFINGYLK